MHSSTKQPLIGVIDMGSNSVRLVVYDGLKRVPKVLYNEKYDCRLGDGLEETGRLTEASKARTRKAVGRFVYLAKHMEVSELYAQATAALRDAEDGPEFVTELRETFGIEPEVISGRREAELAALGVMASLHKTQGFAGDFGGGSFELVKLHHKRFSARQSLPMGALRLVDKAGSEITKMREVIRDYLGQVEWLTSSEDTTQFYAIGGGFRSLAKLHMVRTGYPLEQLHGYTLESDVLMPFLQELEQIPPSEWGNIDGLATRRITSFLPSLLILQEVIRQSGCERVIFSRSGIREGLLYDRLPAEERSILALPASLKNIQNKRQMDKEYSRVLEAWIMSVAPEAVTRDSKRHVLHAMCELGDMALPITQDFRAQWAFDHVIQANIWGMSHRERVLLALAVYHRYRRRWREENNPLLQLVNERQRTWAQLVGQLAEFAFELSGGVGELLKDITLKRAEDGQLSLSGTDEALAMIPPTSEKRLDGLSGMLSAYESFVS